MVLDVESQEIVSQKTFQNFLTPRAYTECLYLARGYAKTVLRADQVCFLQHLGKQGKMVVLDKNKCLIISNFF